MSQQQVVDTRLVKQVHIDLPRDSRLILAWALMTEGSIVVRVCHLKSSAYEGYIPVLSFTSTDYNLTAKVRELAGCGYIYHVKVPKHPRERDTWRWSLHRAHEVLQILEQIYPFLIVKREQALLTMELCRLKIERGARGYNQFRHRRSTFYREQAIRNQVTTLNRAHKSWGAVMQ